eukprot:m.100923 g.100923  ORF g.100923 m.100923 type:complete len:471 (+) comp15639_c2_seq10:62-1474(+)
MPWQAEFAGCSWLAAGAQAAVPNLRLRLTGSDEGVAAAVLSAGGDAIASFDVPVRWTLYKSAINFEPPTTASFSVTFASPSDATGADGLLKAAAASIFARNRESTSVSEYFRYYGHLSQQQNMLTDFTRTGTYQRAIFSNCTDFAGKVVCDVGCGTGILSFFAAQAGAKTVYAVEASSMAENAEKLAKENNMDGVVKVVRGTCEELELPEPVDLIVSEPMGIMLVNERMLESFVHARKWLKPGGKMFPSTATMFACPFSDEQLYFECINKANFWTMHSFYGVNVSSLHTKAMQEVFRQPVVEYIDPRYLLAEPVKVHFDFMTATIESLEEIVMPFVYQFAVPTLVHGMASWFDVSFDGSTEQVILSTAPTTPLTHWYQVRCLFDRPLLVTPGNTLQGELRLKANRIQSYDIALEASIPETGVSTRNLINLKEPNFRFSGVPMAPAAQQTEYNYTMEEQDAQNIAEEVNVA